MKRLASSIRPWARRLFLLIVFSGLAVQILFSSTLLIAESFTIRGRAAQSAEYSDIALKLYERAYRWTDRDPNLLYSLGVLRRQSGKGEAAAEVFARGLDLSPHEIPTLIAYAELLAFAGDFQQAEIMIDRASVIAPDYWRTEEVAGLVRGLQGDHAGAAAHSRRAEKLSGNPGPELLNRLANALYELDEPAQALGYADRALKAQELQPDHHLIRGKVLLALERFDGAAEALGWAESVYAERVAGDLPEQGKLDEARRHLVPALIAQKRPHRAIEVLAGLATSRGPTDGVIALARELEIALDTLDGHRDSVAQFHLAKVMMIVRDYEAADVALARAPSGLSKEQKVMRVILRGQNLFMLSRPQEALTVLQELADQDRQSLEYRIVLADALAASDDVAGARREYSNVLQKFPLPDELRRRVQARRDALSPQ